MQVDGARYEAAGDCGNCAIENVRSYLDFIEPGKTATRAALFGLEVPGPDVIARAEALPEDTQRQMTEQLSIVHGEQTVFLRDLVA